MLIREIEKKWPGRQLETQGSAGFRKCFKDEVAIELTTTAERSNERM